MKRKIEKILRLIGMERLIFYYVFAKDYRKNSRGNTLFSSEQPSVRLPPAFLRFDVTATTNASSYYQTGKETAEKISKDYQHHVPSNTAASVLEWGCGPGRLIQHMPSFFHHTELNLYGADMYKPSIDWASTFLAEFATFYRNRINPPLRFKSNTFDFVYAVSVFTHLSEQLSKDWMKEILRVVKPNGLFWFSCHSGKQHLSKLNTTQRAKINNHEYVSIHSFHDGSQMYEGLHPEPWMRMIIQEAKGEVVDYQFLGLQNYQDIYMVRKLSL